MINEDTENSDHEQEFGEDESSQSSKSHEFAPKGTTKASDSPLKSSKKIGKQSYSTSAQSQSDSESICDGKLKHPPPRNPSQLHKEIKVRHHLRVKRPVLRPLKGLLAKQPL